MSMIDDIVARQREDLPRSFIHIEFADGFPPAYTDLELAAEYATAAEKLWQLLKGISADYIARDALKASICSTIWQDRQIAEKKAHARRIMERLV